MLVKPFIVHRPYFFIFFKDLSSCTDSSESSSECSRSASFEDEDSEDWHEDVDDLLEDMAGGEPLREPTHHQSVQSDYIDPVAHLFFAILTSIYQAK